MTDLTAVSLFAGIGGIDLALQRSGVKVVAAVEIDEAARGILARHFPETRLFSDVREVTGAGLRAAGLVPERGIIAAGWPCQGNSVAGRRRGLADPRSGLWAHVLRLLAETGAAWFLGENVPGLLSVNGGADFGSVLAGLAGLGMGFCWRVLDAQHFGVPQRRRRVLIVGRAGDRDARLPVQVLLEPEGSAGHPAAGGETRPRAAATAGRSADDARPGIDFVGTLGTGAPRGGFRVGADEAAAGQLVAVTTLQGGGRRGHRIDAEGAAGGHLIPLDLAQITSGENRSNPQPGDPVGTLAATGQPAVARLRPMAFNPQAGGSVDHVSYGEIPTALQASQITGVQTAAAVRRLTPVECERLQGFPDGWTEGQSDSARYRQLGNSVAVPCLEWVGRRLVAADSRAQDGAA